ncbi:MULTISPECIES: hypothetical protein [Spirulina sp. CCY15215]|uniref:hypothetical protein n=1 Tax=Spirulina sp. CCY15215 TaxID=2767591 RepID=UPI001950F096|nr:hypothetical protein [Spirulina major]
MLAILLVFSLFVFWLFVGYAIINLLNPKNNSFQNTLLAPVIGMSVTLLLVFWGNRLGIPVKFLGIPITITLFCSSILIYYIQKIEFPWKKYFPFVGIFLFSTFLTGSPFLEFGFNWISYANPDMTSYYTISAKYFSNHSYFDLFSSNFLTENANNLYLGVASFVRQGHRVGSDLLLAWISSVTGLPVYAVFMPLILVFHLVLISTTGALIYTCTGWLEATFWTCLMMSVSALVSLGTFYQLFAQMSGLGFLIGSIILLFDRVKSGDRNSLLKYGILAGLPIASLLITYSEVSIFLGTGFFAFMLITWIKKRKYFKLQIVQTLAIASITLLFLNTYLADLIRFIIFILNYIQGDGFADKIFPYFLIPSGLANLWGIQHLAKLPSEPWLSFGIFLGAILLVTMIFAIAFKLPKTQPIILFTGIMLSLGFYLFIAKKGFTLFKLGMFIQPFLLGSFVLFCLTLIPSRVMRLLPLMVLGILNLSTQLSYLEDSRGFSTVLVEIYQGSSSGVYSEAKVFMDAHKNDPILIHTNSRALLGVLGFYKQDKTIHFLNINRVFEEEFNKENSQNKYLFDLHETFKKKKYNLFFKENLNLENQLFQEKNTILVTTNHKETLNFQYFTNDLSLDFDDDFVPLPLKNVKNYLLFLSSQLGPRFYPSQPDYFFRNSTSEMLRDRKMVPLGQHFLFQVIHPSPNARLMLDMTTSLQGDGKNQLPPAAAIGTKRELLPLTGRGSARVISPPLTPQTIAGGQYISLDMGREGEFFTQSQRQGLMNLYGREVRRDPRKLVGFGRNISLISPEEYANLQPPSSLSSFPDDLANSALEYSGMYEDSWLSESVYFTLTPKAEQSQLKIQGMLPQIDDPNFTTELTVLVNEKPIATRVVSLGEFELEIPLSLKLEKQKIQLQFSQYQKLPDPDNRPVTILLKFVGFTRP